MPKPIKRPFKTTAPFVDLTKENKTNLNKKINKAVDSDCFDEWVGKFLSTEPENKTPTNASTTKKSVVTKSQKKKDVNNKTCLNVDQGKKFSDSDCSDDWLKEFSSTGKETQKAKASKVVAKSKNVDEDNSKGSLDFDATDDSFDEYFPPEQNKKPKRQMRKPVRLNYSVVKDFEGFNVRSDIFCSICNSYFNTMPGHPQNNEDHILKVHARVVGDGLYLCNHCDMTAPKTFKLFKQHFFKHRDMAKPKVCPGCDESFLNYKKWRCHLRTCKEPERIPLERSGSSELQKHKRVRRPCNTFTCEKCGLTLSSSSTLRNHIAAIHDKKGTVCKWCAQVVPYDEWPEHKEMEKIKHNVRIKVDCEICLKTFSSKHSLACHRRNYHGNIVKECKICQEKFSSSTALSQHMTLKHTEKRYKCAYCEYRHVYRFDIVRHLIKTKKHQMKKNEIPDDAVIDLGIKLLKEN